MPRIRYTTTSAATINSGTVPSDCWKACAVPWKLELSVAGAPRSAMAFCTASVACPSATPWARLKLIVIAGRRRFQIDLVQRVEAALQLRQDLHHDVIAVELGEVLRHLALAEGVIERVVDQLRGDSVTRGGVAVDLQLQRRALGLLVGGDVAQLRQCLHLAENLRRPLIELGEVGVLQREFELGAGRPAAEAHVLRCLHIEAGA